MDADADDDIDAVDDEAADDDVDIMVDNDGAKPAA